MKQIQGIHLTLNGRAISFMMEIDPNFIQDRNLIHCLRQDGCCEPEVVHVMAHALREGDLAIDAGAAVGFFTLLMATLVGPKGHVIAVEPAENNFVKLRANMRLNNATNVILHKRALWSCDAVRMFYMYEDSGSNSLAPIAGEYKSAPACTTTVTDLCRGREPRLIKIDCEGAEAQIINGFPEYQIPFVLMELNEGALKYFGSTPFGVIEEMASRGYSLFLIHRDDSFPTYIPPGAYDQLRFTRANTNVLFSKWEHVIEAWPDIQT
jgi:FkbM family methyltransferase